MEMQGEHVIEAKKHVHGRLQGGDGHSLFFGLSEDAKRDQVGDFVLPPAIGLG